VKDGGGGLTVSGVSRNRGGFVKCVAIQKRLQIPGLVYSNDSFTKTDTKIVLYKIACYLLLSFLEHLPLERVNLIIRFPPFFLL
jgi:hypothetical protein